MSYFNSDRNREAANLRNYHEGLAEINAPRTDMAQLKHTRGPDPIGEDLAWLKQGLLIGLSFAAIALVTHFRAWEWAETIIEGVR